MCSDAFALPPRLRCRQGHKRPVAQIFDRGSSTVDAPPGQGDFTHPQQRRCLADREEDGWSVGLPNGLIKAGVRPVQGDGFPKTKA